MKTSGCVRKLTGTVLTLVAGLMFVTVALAGEPTLAVTGFPKSAASGASLSFRLAAFNPSAETVEWTFPSQVVCRLSSSQGEAEAMAIPTSTDQASNLSIPPGQFRWMEYGLTLPQRVTGPVTIEFGELAVSRVVVDMRVEAEETSAKQASGGFWNKLLRDVEPQEAGTGLEPGRFFKEHFFPYDPFYFVAGTESPNAKFQISFKYRLLNDEGALAEKAPALTGLHLAYTQTSLWDWNQESRPFYDSSYRPELLYSLEKVAGGRPDQWFRLDLQTGLQHESNGKSGADSRSLNIVYLRPTIVLGRDDALQLTLIPRFWVHVDDLEDNPDLKDYRGYGDLRAVLGWKRGFQISALGRLGDDWDHGSLQLDATYPMMRLLKGSFSLYLHAQYFTGYGESFLGYREQTSMFRAGISLYR